MSNRGTVVSLIGIVLVLFFVLWLAGCGGGNASTEDAETSVRTLIEQQIEEENLDTLTVTAVDCVKESSRRYQCIVTGRDGDGPEEEVAGTLTCEGDNVGDQCIWRGELRGG